MLSNVFLHYVLDLWFEKKLRRQVRGHCSLVRYADDFICMVQKVEDARYIKQALQERFAAFGLELHPAKLRGHYQYYGVSGNMRSLRAYYAATLRLALKWLNRRSQRKAFSWKGFMEYLKHYPLPEPRITCNLYTLSPVT